MLPYFGFSHAKGAQRYFGDTVYIWTDDFNVIEELQVNTEPPAHRPASPSIELLYSRHIPIVPPSVPLPSSSPSNPSVPNEQREKICTRRTH